MKLLSLARWRLASWGLISLPFDWQNVEQEVAKEVNAMSNYEFLKLLDAIFEEAAKEVAR